MNFPKENSLLSELLDDERIAALARALGQDADLYLVGGTVRDCLLGERPADLDLATVLLPAEVIRRLESAGIRVVPTGLQHQTVTAVPVDGEMAVEITTFRGPGMTPQGGVVAGGSIEEDLRYRDFTVNAMAFSLNEQRLVDPLSGRDDLRDKLLRAAGDASDRFREDPLRMLRLVRLAAEKSFAIDEATGSAVSSSVKLLEAVSVERIRDEIVKILLSPAPTLGFRRLVDFGLLPIAVPELVPMVGCEQNRFHRADVFFHTLEVVERAEPDLVLRLGALLHDMGKPHTISIDAVTGDRHFFHHESVGAELAEELLTRLRFSTEVTREVALLVRTHMRPLEAGAGGLRRLLRDVGDLYPSWRKLKEADIAACRIEPDVVTEKFRQFDQAMEDVLKGPPVSPLASLAVNGNDLLALGIPEGPIVGKLLRGLHERVLDAPELNTKEILLAMVPEVRAGL